MAAAMCSGVIENGDPWQRLGASIPATPDREPVKGFAEQRPADNC